MSEDAGIENLEEETGVEDWGEPGDEPQAPYGKPPPSPQPAISAPPPPAAAPATAGVESPPAASPRLSEDETLAKIIESLGGRDQARKLTLSVKRRRRGEPWKQLRPVPIEDWMVQEGLSAAEVIGDQYGNGSYKWELRTQGRYCASGYCDLEGFDHVPDEKVLSEEEEIEAPAQEAQTIPVGELVQGAVEAAMKPMADLVGSLRGDLAAILSARLQAPATSPIPAQSDPALQTLIGILAQQNTALFELVGKSLTERSNPAAAPSVPKEDHFRSNLRNLKELVGIANELRTTGLPIPGIPADTEEDNGATDEGGEVLEFPAPATQEPAGKANLFDRAGAQVSEALERVLSNFLRFGEEKLQSEVLSGTPAQQATPAPASLPTPPISIPSETLKDMERLFGLVDQCVRNGITVEEFKEHVLSKVPERFVNILRTGTLNAAQLAELSKHLGKSEITARLNEPKVQEYLSNLLKLFAGSEETE